MRILPLLLAACSEYEFHPGEDELPGDTATVEPVELDDGSADTWDLSQSDVDVLFFGDTSGSMAVELKTLGGQVTDFVERLSSYTDRWQLLAVTGPDGCGNGGVLSADVADYAALFAAGITTAPGADEVDEWGLYNAAQALEMTDDGECNAGFLRDDARLHVIFISDEDDNSPGWDSGDEEYWRPYVDQILDRKGDPDLVLFSGVIGPLPDGCDGAEPGRGYAEAVEATGGELLSICEAWYDELDSLVDASIRYALFHLSEVPLVDSLEVSVNGDLRLSGWSYDETDNAIRFVADAPVMGDHVTVTYDPAG